jgi:3-methyladenine DNA glycosylase/8-oxoguanine DNA glycosylase
MTRLRLATPPDFKFWATVGSHGWCELPPFGYDDATHTLTRIQQLSDGQIVYLTINENQMDGLSIHVEGAKGKLKTRQADEIREAVRRCLNLDQDISVFHGLVRDHPRYGWIERLGVGRMLSSPTVWEDLVKTLLTTNTTWNMTVQMCRRLATLGDSYPGGGHAFPTPERLAAMSADELNSQVRAGYRGAYLHELAARVVNGELDIESWRSRELSGTELFKRVKALKGFGDYAAGSVLKLLGHFDRLATDSECREAYKKINGGLPGTDKEIAAYYDPFGQWRGLVQWMDVMADYLQSP